MDYLYFLQNLREGMPTWFNEAVLFVSEFIGGAGGLALLALIYWCIDKRAGAFLMMNFSFSQVLNGFVKNIFRVERPFNRDPRLTPYKTVSGYSFPSGHTMMAASFYGGTAVWQRKRKWLAAFCVFMAFLVAFTRNWLGAHTIEDVLVALLLSVIIIALNAYLIGLADRKKNADIFIFIGSAVVCALYCILFPDSMKSAGMYGGVMVGWIIERRLVRFEISGGIFDRITAYIPGAVITGLIYKFLPKLLEPLGNNVSGTLNYFVTFVFILAGWPALMKLFTKKADKIV